MKLSHISLLIIATIMICACGKTTETPSDSEADRALAREAARTMALQLAADAKGDTLVMQQDIIEASSAYNRLINNGHPQAADDFRESFFATLDSINPGLANQIR